MNPFNGWKKQDQSIHPRPSLVNLVRSPTTPTRPPRSQPRRSTDQRLSGPSKSSPVRTTCPAMPASIRSLAPTSIVDGFDCPDTRTVYEFQGCFTHGCPTLLFKFVYEKHPRHYDRSMQDVYDTTQRKEPNSLPRARVHRSFKYGDVNGNTSERKPNLEIDSERTKGLLTLSQPLQSSGGFLWRSYQCYVKLYHHITPGSKDPLHRCHLLVPMDQQNLSSTPKDIRPSSHNPGHTDIQQYFGLIQCQVLPPRHLYHPVLPYRQEGKLTFSPLCHLCSRRNPQEDLFWTDPYHVSSHRRTTRPSPVPGAARNYTKAVELGYDRSNTSMKSGISDETCEGLFAKITSTPG